jgi:hypothetical protein
MSRGLGRVQREILALTKVQPGPWTVEELCRLVYKFQPGLNLPTKRAQRVAVGRALKSMVLPGKWRVGRIWPDCRTFLYDASRENDVGVTVTTTEVEVEAIPDWSDGWIEVTFDDMPETEIILTGLLPDGEV